MGTSFARDKGQRAEDHNKINYFLFALYNKVFLIKESLKWKLLLEKKLS